MHRAGLGLYNFMTGPNSLPSYRTTLYFGSVSGVVNIDLVGQNTSVVYLAFSVVIVTENVPHL